MFRAAHRSSSGAITVFAASGLHMHVVTDLAVITCVCKPQAANTVTTPDGEWCAAQNMLSLQ
jgi:hypothetical protein